MIQMIKNILCVSSFFLLHRYNLEVLNFSETPQETMYTRSPIQAAENIMSKLKKACKWAEASMTSTQQDYKDQANTRRSSVT
ncbi:pol-like protein [Histoplasma ohiense]|nr:pol-like protein [Histoplasma ohiense (nom. inval.)]